MFGLSTWEILIILVLALLFIGPDELPKMANKLGKGLRQVRGAMSKVDDEVRRTVRDFQAEAARLAEDEEEKEKEKEKQKDNDTEDGKPSGLDGPIAANADGTPVVALPAPAEEPVVEAAVVPELATRDLGSLAAKTSINARDWSKIGKAPVEGRVATVLPGRPPTASMAPPAHEPAPPPTPPPATAGTPPPERS